MNLENYHFFRYSRKSWSLSRTECTSLSQQYLNMRTLKGCCIHNEGKNKESSGNQNVQKTYVSMKIFLKCLMEGLSFWLIVLLVRKGLCFFCSEQGKEMMKETKIFFMDSTFRSYSRQFTHLYTCLLYTSRCV